MGHLAAAVFAKEVVFLFRMGGRGEPGHVFHQAQDGLVHLRIAEHVHAAEHVRQRHRLRSGYNHGGGHGNIANEGNVNVAGSRRHVDEQEIQRPPGGLQDNLLEGGGGHGAAPDERLPGL